MHPRDGKLSKAAPAAAQPAVKAPEAKAPGLPANTSPVTPPTPNDGRVPVETEPTKETLLSAVPENVSPTKIMQRSSFISGYDGSLLFCDYMLAYWKARREYIVKKGDPDTKIDTSIADMEKKLADLKAKKAELTKSRK